MARQVDLNRLLQAIRTNGPADPKTRVKYSQVTTREVHPDYDFRNTLAVLRPGVASQVGSLNTTAGEKAFHWAISGFGWSQGYFE